MGRNNFITVQDCTRQLLNHCKNVKWRTQHTVCCWGRHDCRGCPSVSLSLAHVGCRSGPGVAVLWLKDIQPNQTQHTKERTRTDNGPCAAAPLLVHTTVLLRGYCTEGAATNAAPHPPPLHTTRTVASKPPSVLFRPLQQPQMHNTPLCATTSDISLSGLRCHVIVPRHPCMHAGAA